MKKLYVPMELHRGDITVGGVPHLLRLPERCNGLLLCFETKKAAREFMGEDSEIMEIERA